MTGFCKSIDYARETNLHYYQCRTEMERDGREYISWQVSDVSDLV